jgi:small subunit ribosomal protein S20
LEIIQDSTTFAIHYREERHLVPMANHKSSLKRIRANRAKYLRNRYQMKTTRTFIKRLRATTQKTEASELYKKVVSMIDKLAKKKIIHKNNAANKKSKLAKYVNRLA